jgi:hypothetical protein
MQVTAFRQLALQKKEKKENSYFLKYVCFPSAMEVFVHFGAGTSYTLFVVHFFLSVPLENS